MAQWIERPPGVRGGVMGLIPVGDPDFFFVPRSCHVDFFIFLMIALLTNCHFFLKRFAALQSTSILALITSCCTNKSQSTYNFTPAGRTGLTGLTNKSSSMSWCFVSLVCNINISTKDNKSSHYIWVVNLKVPNKLNSKYTNSKFFTPHAAQVSKSVPQPVSFIGQLVCLTTS